MNYMVIVRHRVDAPSEREALELVARWTASPGMQSTDRIRGLLKERQTVEITDVDVMRMEA